MLSCSKVIGIIINKHRQYLRNQQNLFWIAVGIFYSLSTSWDEFRSILIISIHRDIQKTIDVYRSESYQSKTTKTRRNSFLPLCECGKVISKIIDFDRRMSYGIHNVAWEGGREASNLLKDTWNNELSLVSFLHENPFFGGKVLYIDFSKNKESHHHILSRINLVIHTFIYTYCRNMLVQSEPSRLRSVQIVSKLTV